RPALPVPHQRPGGPARDLPVPRRPAVEEVVQEAAAARVREKLRAVADEPPRRDAVLEAHAPRPVIRHLDHLASPRADLLGYDADVLLGAVDHQVLHGLEPLAVLRPGDDL